MKELKAGMYVRTHNGFISKIIEISREPISRNEIILIKGNYKGNKDEEYGYVRDYYKKGTSFVYRGEIKEVSENIIDLIEENDFINGLRVEKNKYGELYTSYVYYGGDIGKQCEVYTTWLKEYTEDMIENIVTKEQFNSVKYEVE